MDSHPSKEEIEAVFHRLRAVSGNKVSEGGLNKDYLMSH